MNSEIKTPLFWDLHIHGVSGVDFISATFDSMAYACEALGKHGIGYFAPTLLTAPMKLMEKSCKNWGVFIGKTKKKGYLPLKAALPIGLHLEGPLLNLAMPGAHPKKDIKKATPDDLLRLLKLSQDQVRIVTLAPERKNILELIPVLVKNKIRVQIGHTLATQSEAMEAFKKGACGITHCFNAMRWHHRDLGVFAPFFSGKISSEIITDGIHVHPELIFWTWLKQTKLYAVSDGCCLVGTPPGTLAKLGTVPIVNQAGAAFVKNTQTLAGGSTYLSAHPFLLNNKLKNNETWQKDKKVFLNCFFKFQKEFFVDVAHPETSKNFFHPQTLKFLARS